MHPRDDLCPGAIQVYSEEPQHAEPVDACTPGGDAGSAAAGTAPASGAEKSPGRKEKLSDKEKTEWETATPRIRAQKRFMMLARTIMHQVKKMAWKPTKRPTEEQVQTFVLRTLGGWGKFSDDNHCFALDDHNSEDLARANQVSPMMAVGDSANLHGRWCGKFYWKGGGGGVDTLEPAQYIVADTSKYSGTEDDTTNIHLLRYYAIHQVHWPCTLPHTRLHTAAHSLAHCRTLTCRPCTVGPEAA